MRMGFDYQAVPKEDIASQLLLLPLSNLFYLFLLLLYLFF